MVDLLGERKREKQGFQHRASPEWVIERERQHQPGRHAPTNKLPLRLRSTTRYKSWLVIIPMMLVPLLLGAAWTIAGVFILSLLCYREFARATGLFREKLTSLMVVLGIFAVLFAVADHWCGFFMALSPLTIGAIAATAIIADQPRGYIQRVALGVLGLALFGAALGHLAYMA